MAIGKVQVDGHCKVQVDGHCKVQLDGHCKVQLDGHCKVQVDGHCKVQVDGHYCLYWYHIIIVCSLVQLRSAYCVMMVLSCGGTLPVATTLSTTQTSKETYTSTRVFLIYICVYIIYNISTIKALLCYYAK